MSKNKIMLKDGVVSRGGGCRRVIMDYEAGLIYPYQEPDRIIGIYAAGRGWVFPMKPHYSPGGWGRHSTDDADGYRYHTIQNAEDLVRAIGGKRLRMYSQDFLTPKELRKLNRAIAQNNRLVDASNKLALKMGREPNDSAKLESITVKPINDWRDICDASKLTPKGTDPIRTASRYASAVTVFLNGKGKAQAVDGYRITPNVITQGRTVVAFRAQGKVYMNSQLLELTAFEREFMGGQSVIQSEVRKVATYAIPFNVLASAGLKLSETRVLEQGPESDHTLKDGSDRHFTGALLLENAGRKFLMDIDREEIKHGIFNAFFVEVTRNVRSIAEAYESMKPQEVRDAEAKGIEVRRQGEWFFIATGKTLTVPEDDVLYWRRNDENDGRTQYVLRSHVAHGKGRPNTLLKPVGFGELDQYVCGTVTHSGREHRDLELGEKSIGNRIQYALWKLVPNTTISNFTIQGDVD